MRPESIKIHRKSADLELVYREGAFRLSAEYLRVHSPSAEVQGHGPGQAVLQYGKRNVQFNDIQAMGHMQFELFSQTAMTQESTAGHIFGSYVTIMRRTG